MKAFEIVSLDDWIKEMVQKFKDDPEFICEERLLEEGERVWQAATERAAGIAEGLCGTPGGPPCKAMACEGCQIAAKIRGRSDAI